MKTKNVIISVIVILFVLLGIIGYVKKLQMSDGLSIDDILAPPAAADYYEDTNRLKVESGAVTVTRNTGEKEVVTEETDVGMGDTITVGMDAEATLYWFDDSISRLSAGTEITIDKADYNPENINETDIGFEVVTGEVWNKVQNLVDEDSEFLSYSGNIVAGVRGSTYNFLVNDEVIEVDSIRHAAFVGEKNEDEVSMVETIMSGNQALINRGDRFTDLNQVMEVKNITKEKLESLQENIAKDKRDIKTINKKKADRIKKRIGPLPGEAGYEKKMQLIDKKLQSASPEEKTKLQIRIAQMQVQEALAKAMMEGDVGDILGQLQELRDSVDNSGLSDTEKMQILNEIKQNMTAADRALDVLPGQKDLYDMKDALRNMRIGLENNPQEREWLENRLVETRLYEMHDWAKYNGFDPEQFENLAEQYFIGMERLQEFLRNNPEFKDLAESMMAEVEGKPVNLEQLQLLREQFELTESEAQIIKQTIENIPKTPMPVIPEDSIKLLDQPVPTPEIIENAPYHQGPSPM